MMKRYLYCSICVLLLFSNCKKDAPVPDTDNRLEVVNQGVPGNTAADLLVRIKNVTDLRPNIVLVMIGTNDALSGGKAFQNYQSNLSKIISSLQSAGAKVILLTPPPSLRSSAFYAENSRLSTVCSTISKLGKRKSCGFIDIYSYMDSLNNQVNSPVLYNPDGLHPNKIGYVNITNRILSYLKINPIKGGYRIVCFGDSITYGYEVDGQGSAVGDTYPADLERGINHYLVSYSQSSE